MDEKALIEKIVELFKQKTMEYSEKLNAYSYDVDVYYLKNNKEKGYNFIDAILEFKSFFLKIEYKINTSMLLPTSTLEMRILFKGGKFPIEYSIYDLLNIIDESNFNCYTIPYITETETMEYALEYLASTFTRYKERIEELFHNDKEFAKLEENVREQVEKLMGKNIFKSRNALYLAHMLEVYYVLDAARFCTEIYADYVLTGKYKYAIKGYNTKKHKLTLYETRLKQYISKLKDPIKFLPEKLETTKSVKQYKKVGIKQRLITLLSFTLLSLIWSIGYLVVYMIAHNYIARNAIYTSNFEFPITIILGIITASINMFFAKKTIKKHIYKEKYGIYKMIEKFQNAEHINNFMTKVFQFIIALSILTSILAANTYIKFTPGSIFLNEKYLSLKSREIAYSDVDSVYKTEKIVMDFGYEVETSTYVIVLKDNTKIELFWYMDAKEVEENILPLIKEKRIPIENVDVITNIPNI